MSQVLHYMMLCYLTSLPFIALLGSLNQAVCVRMWLFVIHFRCIHSAALQSLSPAWDQVVSQRCQAGSGTQVLEGVAAGLVAKALGKGCVAPGLLLQVACQSRHVPVGDSHA